MKTITFLVAGKSRFVPETPEDVRALVDNGFKPDGLDSQFGAYWNGNGDTMIRFHQHCDASGWLVQYIFCGSSGDDVPVVVVPAGATPTEVLNGVRIDLGEMDVLNALSDLENAARALVRAKRSQRALAGEVERCEAILAEAIEADGFYDGEPIVVDGEVIEECVGGRFSCVPALVLPDRTPKKSGAHTAVGANEQSNGKAH